MQFILGAMTGFGLAVFFVLFLFFGFLVCKALFFLILSPGVSFEILKIQPAFYYPLFRLIALDVIFGLMAYGCFVLYKKYFKDEK